MSCLTEIADNDEWRCWLCDQPVDPEIASSDPRGASLDTRITNAKAKRLKKRKRELPEVRLAHIGCNTGKGSQEPVVPWAEHLFVIDPVAIIGAMETLERKGGRAVFARCPTEKDATEARIWLVDRVSRLHPDLALQSRIDGGGQQYMVSLYL